jgi:hypothetical protein
MVILVNLLNLLVILLGTHHVHDVLIRGLLIIIKMFLVILVVEMMDVQKLVMVVVGLHGV